MGIVAAGRSQPSVGHRPATNVSPRHGGRVPDVWNLARQPRRPRLFRAGPTGRPLRPASSHISLPSWQLLPLPSQRRGHESCDGTPKATRPPPARKPSPPLRSPRPMSGPRPPLAASSAAAAAPQNPSAAAPSPPRARRAREEGEVSSGADDDEVSARPLVANLAELTAWFPAATRGPRGDGPVKRRESSRAVR